MKKLIVISIILLVGISVQAQSGGRPVLDDCYKCVTQEAKPLLYKVCVVSPFIPFLPVIDGYIKSLYNDIAMPTHKKDDTHPGPLPVPNENYALPTKPVLR